jgi:hypothetical protein
LPRSKFSPRAVKVNGNRSLRAGKLVRVWGIRRLENCHEVLEHNAGDLADRSVGRCPVCIASALSCRETLGGAVASNREVIELRRCRGASTRPAHRDASDGTRSGLVGSRGSTAQYAADAATAGNEAGLAVDRTFTT